MIKWGQLMMENVLAAFINEYFCLLLLFHANEKSMKSNVDKLQKERKKNSIYKKKKLMKVKFRLVIGMIFT